MGLIMHVVTLLLVVLSVNLLAISATLDTYIIHVESPRSGQTQISTEDSDSSVEDLDSYYQSFLPVTTSDEGDDKAQITHSYHNVFRGFSARLSAGAVKEMSEKPGFISAKQETMYQLSTTHTPRFLGLHQNFGFWNRSNYGKGVIIGVLDTGITPGHPSFNDAGVPPPPAKWKGKCDLSGTACNNKLIGARYFVSSPGDQPIDTEGHGTHTSSTAAGNFVRGANVFGNANGTAVGVAPLAHIAVYQVCSSEGCLESDILAAMDAAISDGVDVLSLSLGATSAPFQEDSLALGAFSAIKKGIFVSCAAGNRGPKPSSLSNDAPWILTVGASTTDRMVVSTAVLGNNVQLNGQSLYQPKNFSAKQYPLYSPTLNRLCDVFENDENVKGKIVVCEPGLEKPYQRGNNVKDAGGVGMIVVNSEMSAYTIQSTAEILPATRLSYEDGLKLASYMASTKFPTAAITFKGTVIGSDRHAPQVAAFSSRGPSLQSPGILKPDIIGPGVDILAAWPESVPIAISHINRTAIWNVISGTSMSTPHLSGIAALLKSAHPDWSPAAIKSAMMTTADVENLLKHPIEDEQQLPASLFSIGSGHVNPSRANGPGLVYDIHPEDYIPYLCGLLNSDKNVSLIVQQKVNCSAKPIIAESQLNYPSFTVMFKNGSSAQKYTRTVTNVGKAGSVYTAKVVSPQGVSVKVSPSTLHFSKLHQKLTYAVTFTRSGPVPKTTSMAGGSITWFSNKHMVRSPIAARFI